jgi:hypothetical protein
MNDEELETMNISLLCGHVSQLTQSISQFALKPGDEEIKKKGWWRFWRRLRERAHHRLRVTVFSIYPLQQ